MAKVTKEQIEAWKSEHGEVFKIKVDGKEAFLKKPTRKILGYATAAGKDNPLKFNEALLNNCWLGGDEEIKTNDDLFLAASGVLAEIIQVKEAELEKL